MASDRRSAEAVAREFSRTLAAEANEFDDTVTLGVEQHAARVADLLRADRRRVLRARPPDGMRGDRHLAWCNYCGRRMGDHDCPGGEQIPTPRAVLTEAKEALLQNTLDAAEAENVRLREALEKIANASQWSGEGPMGMVSRLVHYAVRALAPQPAVVVTEADREAASSFAVAFVQSRGVHLGPVEEGILARRFAAHRAKSPQEGP